MKNMLNHLYTFGSYLSLAVILACSSDPTSPSKKTIATIGRLERGSTIHVLLVDGDTVRGSSLSLTVTPQEAAAVNENGTITLLGTGPLTIHAWIVDDNGPDRTPGTGFTASINVETPPSILFDLEVDGRRAIYKTDLDGLNFSRISSDVGTNIDPTTAGDIVVFTSFRNGQADLYSLSLTGSAGQTERRITPFRHNDTQPALSPDGQTIAFVRDTGGVGRIWVWSNNDANPARLTSSTNPSPESSPSWSADGRLIFTTTESGGADIAIASSARPSIVSILQSASSIFADVEAVWNAEGTKIAYISTRSGKPHLYIWDALAQQVTYLQNAGTNVAQPAWLRDGRIVFVSQVERVWKLDWVDLKEPDTIHTIPLPVANGQPQNPTAIR